ncbi:hypothetical protein ZEAMMB73_Zm00001d029390 [Zea mays]|uniref:Uncharacterized protein n=1 Tax=Zea mays TaxID=4577 RepID=A0A1D6K4V1_MAIZE|nr:hypothetical protein ZEAMMB73_Zm00001d029390 [Zea mays]
MLQVTMVLYEVLRLYPPATSVVRQTYKEMEVGGVTYPARRDPGAACAAHPPRPGHLGRRRARVQARQVLRGRVQGLQGPRRVPPVRLGPAHLHRPELRAAGGQDGALHDPPAVRVRARAILRSCAAYRDNLASYARCAA